MTSASTQATRLANAYCLAIITSTYKDGDVQVLDELRNSQYQVGEVVAVAQSYKDCGLFDIYQGPKDTAGWTNKMFVRANLMPHQIRITNVRMERLQDITDEDCLAEGIYKGQCGSADTHFMDAYYFKGDKQPYCSPRNAYASLIDRISRKGTWESNPYVFVYDFELVD